MADLVFRADASAAIGTGHVMRAIAVAEALAERGHRCHLASAQLPDRLAGRARAAAMALAPLGPDLAIGDTEDRLATSTLCARLGATAVIVDGLTFTPGYLAGLRADGLMVACFDDTAQRSSLPADLVINASLAADITRYRALAPEAELLLGPDHAPLRREFRQAIQGGLPPLDARPDVFIGMGGADPPGLTGPLLDMMAECLPAGVRLHGVVGAANPRMWSLRFHEHRLRDRASLHIDSPNLAAVMARCGLAVTAAGSTTAELAAMGVPMILAVIADNQVPNADAVAALGPVPVLDARDGIVVIPTLVDLATRLWADPAARADQLSVLAPLADPQGALRIADRIDARLAAAGARGQAPVNS